ncbi:MAG TPA: L,D-transpeptidase family protein [Beijerinckiaceae bacterium]|nr:L,D-transpeptidase family protein [Beijerinckiaceae bacterium]
MVNRKTKNTSSRQVSRAVALTGVGALLAISQFGPAWAGSGSLPGFNGQAEWVQNYDVDPSQAVRRSTTPLLSKQTIADTQQAIVKYQQLVDKGGWPSVPTGHILKVGSTGSSIIALRRRLIAAGDMADLGSATDASPVFDSYVAAGVRRFQVRHGLAATGVVNKETFSALNVPASVRLRELQINLIRLRAFSGDLGRRFVELNIPAAEVETVENDRVVTHHIAGVGRIDRQSPVMQTRALDINFNPYWTVPISIIRKDLIPLMQKHPNYLTKNKIRIFDKDGNEVSPTSINWDTTQAVSYRFRQDPGGDINALGSVRVNIANPYGVYMHDTNEKGIFGDDYRFVSSGCVRVQDVRDFVAWLLEDNPGWDRNKIDDVIASGKQVNVTLTKPVNVYWVYITAWANGGVVQFRPDIYKRDGFDGGDVASATPAQGGGSQASPVLQPVSMH